MKSAAGLSLPLISVRGIWHHAFTSGRSLKVTPPGFQSVSGITRSRFNPGDSHDKNSGFETLHLALDRETALFEKRVQFGSPYGDPVNLIVSSRIKNTVVVPVEVNLDAVLDLSNVAVHATLDTNAQEITGDWDGYAQRERGLAPPMGVLVAPTGLAPTQQLAMELFREPRVKGIISISAKVPTTCCLVVFTHKMRSPDYLSWDDPNTGKARALSRKPRHVTRGRPAGPAALAALVAARANDLHLHCAPQCRINPDRSSLPARHSRSPSRESSRR